MVVCVVSVGHKLRAVQKRLNRSKCRLRSGLGFAQGTVHCVGRGLPHGKGAIWGNTPCDVNVNANVDFYVTLHEQVRCRGTLQY